MPDVGQDLPVALGAAEVDETVVARVLLEVDEREVVVGVVEVDERVEVDGEDEIKLLEVVDEEVVEEEVADEEVTDEEVADEVMLLEVDEAVEVALAVDEADDEEEAAGGLSTSREGKLGDLGLGMISAATTLMTGSSTKMPREDRFASLGLSTATTLRLANLGFVVTSTDRFAFLTASRPARTWRETRGAADEGMTLARRRFDSRRALAIARRETTTGLREATLDSRMALARARRETGRVATGTVDRFVLGLATTSEATERAMTGRERFALVLLLMIARAPSLRLGLATTDLTTLIMGGERTMSA